jgi:hypothetical protein
MDLKKGTVFHLGDPNIKYVVEERGGILIGRQINNQSFVGLEYWKEKIKIIKIEA